MVSAWENGDGEQKSVRKWDMEIALEGGGFSVFTSCEVVTELADNNISNISVPAIGASSLNRSLSVGALSVKTDCFVKSRPKTLAGEPACITEPRKWSTNSTSKHQTMISLAVNTIFPLCHCDLWNGWQHLFLTSLGMCVHQYELMWIHVRSQSQREVYE